MSSASFSVRLHIYVPSCITRKSLHVTLSNQSLSLSLQGVKVLPTTSVVSWSYCSGYTLQIGGSTVGVHFYRPCSVHLSKVCRNELRLTSTAWRHKFHYIKRIALVHVKVRVRHHTVARQLITLIVRRYTDKGLVQTCTPNAGSLRPDGGPVTSRHNRSNPNSGRLGHFSTTQIRFILVGQRKLNPLHLTVKVRGLTSGHMC